MLRQLLRHLIADNPALIYVNADAWRGFRRWGWLWALLPLAALLTFGIEIETLAARVSLPKFILNRLDVQNLTWLVILPLVLWIAAGVCGPLKRLLHEDNVEPLFLSRLAPEQIWAACMINMNRRLLTLFVLLAPVLFLRARIEAVDLVKLLRLCLTVLAIANVWGLLFCALTMQWGIRRAALVNLAIFCVFFALTFSASHEWQGQTPTYVLLNPLSHIYATYFPVRYYRMEPWTRSVTLLGYPCSETAGMLIVYGAMSAVLMLWLAAGPLRLPARREEELMRRVKHAGRGRIGRLFSMLGKVAEIELARFGSANAYSWRYTIDRLYENSIPRFRHSLFWKNFASTALYAVALALVMDSFTGGKVILASNPQHSALYFMVLAIFGLLASFHLCYAGRQDERMRLLFCATEIPASERARAVMFLTKLAFAVSIVWVSGTIHPSVGWQWPFFPLNREMVKLSALIILSNALLLVYVSRRSVFPRQALSAGLLVLLSVTLLPLLLFMSLGYYAPHLLEKPFGLGAICSMTPIIAFADIAREVTWTAKSKLDGNLHAWNANWMWSLGFFAVESMVFGVLLALDLKRRKPTSESRPGAKSADEAESMVAEEVKR